MYLFFAHIREDSGGAIRSKLSHHFWNFHFNFVFLTYEDNLFLVEAGYDTLKIEKYFLFLKIFSSSLYEKWGSFCVCKIFEMKILNWCKQLIMYLMQYLINSQLYNLHNCKLQQITDNPNVSHHTSVIK